MSQKFEFVFASLIVALVAFSCNNLNDNELIVQSNTPPYRPTRPLIVPPLSSSHTVDSVLYTFAIPQATFGINDTLSATLTMYNQSTSVDTLYFECGPAYAILWSLKNDSGRTVIFGGGPVCRVIVPLLLNSHQTLQYQVIDEPIKNIPGILDDQSGSYVLQGQMNNMSPSWSFDFDITIYSPSAPLNLISNSSFESDGRFTLQGWFSSFTDVRSGINPAQDAPSGGGMWSVSMYDQSPSSAPEYITTTVAAPAGNHVYKFSVWTKSSNNFPSSGSSAQLRLDRNGTLTGKTYIWVDETITAWTLNNEIDTIDTISGDSLQVVLSGSKSTYIRQTLFDLVKLEIIE